MSWDYNLCCQIGKRESHRSHRTEVSMSRRNVFFYAVILGLTASNVSAQALGNIVGTVTDQGGASVPGATVTITNEGTQFSRTTTTNDSGQFVANSFPTGRITVTAEHRGFLKLLSAGLELTTA